LKEMPRTYSLQHKKDFDTLFKVGKRRYGKYFTVVFAPAEELKFGLIVQKKVVALASHRNYCRRIMREIIRTVYIPNISSRFHIAIIVKSDLKEIESTSIQRDLIGALSQIR
jgi:ribonuclease P protein component